MKKTLFIIILLASVFIINCKNKNKPGLSLSDIEEIVDTSSLSLKTINNTAILFKDDSCLKHYHLSEKRNLTAEKPIKIDLTSIHDTKEFVLSDLGNKLEYIKLEHPDSNYFTTGGTKIILSQNYIITHNILGISIFDLQGKFIDYIVKNEVQIFKSGRGGFGFSMNDFKGAFSSPTMYGNNLIYVISDASLTEKTIIGLDLSKIASSSNNDINAPTIKGDVLSKRNEFLTTGIMSYFFIDPKALIGFNSFWTTIELNELFYSFNNQGDTLCTFKNFDSVPSFKKKAYRVTESTNIYYFNSELMYRQAYNDTIFKITGKNELAPKYILERGNKRVTTKEGMNPDSDLTGKIIINQIYETDKWLIVVTSNNHVSPINRKKATLSFNYLFYNKKGGECYKRNGKFENEQIGLKNDINNGLNFWPKNVSNEGYLISCQPVKYLLEDHGEEKLSALLPFNQFNNNQLIITILK